MSPIRTSSSHRGHVENNPIWNPARRSGRAVSRTIVLPWLLCCLLLVSACSSGHPEASTTTASSTESAKGTVTVPVTTAGATAATGSWQVHMAATPSARTGATLTIAPPGATDPPAAAPAGLRLGGESARFDLVGAQLGAPLVP